MNLNRFNSNHKILYISVGYDDILAKNRYPFFASAMRRHVLRQACRRLPRPAKASQQCRQQPVSWQLAHFQAKRAPARIKKMHQKQKNRAPFQFCRNRKTLEYRRLTTWQAGGPGANAANAGCSRMVLIIAWLPSTKHNKREFSELLFWRFTANLPTV